jgi:hypothetical protein
MRGFRVTGKPTIGAAHGAAQATTWNGQPITLQQGGSTVMPQTPNGSLVLAYQNQSTTNDQGQLELTSGGSPPEFLPAVALLPVPQILVNHWQGNDLVVTNVSPQPTPIWIEAAGPGLPGQTPASLPIGTPTVLAPAQAAQGVTQPQWMQLMLTTATAQPTTVAIVGGPLDSTGNNAYAIGLNFTTNSGPGTGTPTAQGYYATTTGNSYPFLFNWGGATIYVANMSASTAAAVQLNLIAL